jgi:hypothetical protein
VIGFAYWWGPGRGRIVVEPDAATGSKLLFIYWIHVELVYGLISLPIHKTFTHLQAWAAYRRCRADARALDPKGSFRDAVEDAREGAEPLLDRIQHLLNHVGACVVLVAEVARDRRPLDSMSASDRLADAASYPSPRDAFDSVSRLSRLRNSATSGTSSSVSRDNTRASANGLFLFASIGTLFHLLADLYRSSLSRTRLRRSTSPTSSKSVYDEAMDPYDRRASVKRARSSSVCARAMSSANSVRARIQIARTATIFHRDDLHPSERSGDQESDGGH